MVTILAAYPWLLRAGIHVFLAMPVREAGRMACGPSEACACSHMPVHCTIEAADYPAAEQHLLTIGRAGVLSCRAIAVEELETVLRHLGPVSERQRSNLKRATDIVLQR